MIKKLKETLMYSRVEKALQHPCGHHISLVEHRKVVKVVRLCLTVLKNFLSLDLSRHGISLPQPA